MKWNKELGIYTLWVNFDISLDWEFTGRVWGWTMATLSVSIQRHAWAILPFGLWPLICGMEQGLERKTERLPGFPDVLLNQKAVGGPSLPDRGLVPSHEVPSICLHGMDSPTLTHTLNPGSALGSDLRSACSRCFPGHFPWLCNFDQIQMLQNVW